MSEVKKRKSEHSSSFQKTYGHGGPTSSHGSATDLKPVPRTLSPGSVSTPSTESTYAPSINAPDLRRETSDEIRVNHDVIMNATEFQTASSNLPDPGITKMGSLLSFGERISLSGHSSATEMHARRMESFDLPPRTMIEPGTIRLPAANLKRISAVDELRETAQAKPRGTLSCVRIHQPSAVMLPPQLLTLPTCAEAVGKSNKSATRLWAGLHLPEAHDIGGSNVEPLDGSFEDRRGLRFFPSVLVFRNVFEGERRMLHFALQNVSTRPVKISIIGPSSVFFSLEHPNFSAVLAPGLYHHDTLTLQQYSCHADSILPTSLSVVVNGHTEVYEIQTHFAAPQLDVEPPELDFGTMNLGAPVRVQMLTLRNLGALVGNFAIDVSAQALELIVKPTRGKVHAYKAVSLRCELAPALEGHFTRTVWVRGAGMALRVPVHVHVVRPRLELCYPPAPDPVPEPEPEPKPAPALAPVSEYVPALPPPAGVGSALSARSARLSLASEDSTTERDRVSFAFIDFGPVYFGTKRRLTAAVRSASADICTFVVLAELAGGEVKSMQDARAENPEIRVFRAHPHEGRIESFETRIFTFGFEPQLWVGNDSTRNATEKHDFLLFLRVMRVLCIDIDRQIGLSTLRTNVGKNKTGQLVTDDREDSFTVGEAAELRRQEMLAVRNNVVRLCLHGEAEPVALAITPTALTLGRLALGVTEHRVLRLTNLSSRLPIKIRATRPRPPGVDVTPAHGKLAPGSAIEITVRVAPVCFGEFDRKLKIELLGRSEPLLAPAEFERLGFRYVHISYVCPAELPLPPPRIAMGLSPIINREVGVIGDGVPFCSTVPKPRMAILRADLCNPFYGVSEQPMLDAPAKDFVRNVPSDVSQKAPPSTPERGSCESACNRTRRTCCRSCLAPRVDDWSSSESSNDDDDEDDVVAARRREERAEAAAAAAEVERLLVPDVPRIACGVVMEPISENTAEAAETSDGEATEAQGPDAVISTVLAANEQRSIGCVIGNLLDAVMQARDASSSDSSSSSLSESSNTFGSGEHQGSTDNACGSLRSDSAVTADASRSAEDALQIHASSEKLLNVTEFIPAAAAHTNYVHTDQPQRKTKNIVGNTPATAKKASSSSALLADLGAACGSGDHCDIPAPRHPRTKKMQQQSSTISSSSKNQTRSSVSSFQSLQSLPPAATSSVDIQKPHHSEATKTTKSFNEMSKQPNESSSMLGKMASENIDEFTNFTGTQTPEKPDEKVEAAKDILGEMQQTISLETLNPTPSLNPTSSTSPIGDNSSAVADEVKQVYSEFSATKHCRRINPTRLIRNKVSPKVQGTATKHKHPLKDKLTVLVSKVSMKKELQKMSLPKAPAASKETSNSEDLPTRPPTTPTAKFPGLNAVGQPMQQFGSQKRLEVFSIRQSSRNGKKSLKAQRLHKRRKSKNVEEESDDDDDGLGDVPVTPVSVEIPTPVVSMHPSLPPARDREAEALDVVGRDTRCEALHWARGEQVHPHCAFIAFPNDVAQRSLRPWPSNRLTRSIFTGAPRYVAPIDEDEMLKPEEMLTLREREEMARIDIRDFAERYRALKASRSNDREPMPDYDVADCTLYNYLRFRSGCMGDEEKQAEEEKSRWLTPMKAGSYLLALVPLTPTQLINVRLAPPQVDYGTVGVGSHVSATVVVHNANIIPVKVNATSSITALSVAGDGVVYVEPHNSSELVVLFEPCTLGRFNGKLRYVVNDCHVFEAPVIANVVLRSLILSVQSLRFGFLRGSEEAFPQLVHVVTIKNPLQVACKFEWLAIDRTCYDVIPRRGEVPSLGSRACEVTYSANLDAQTPEAALLLASESDNYLQLSCRLLAPPTVPAGFVRQTHILPELSLLRRRLFLIYLYNASYMDVLFRVEDHTSGPDSPSGMSAMGDQDPPVGLVEEESGAKTHDGRVSWSVRPAKGSMRPRSLRRLYLTVRALAPGPVTFEVRVNLGLDAHAPPTSHGSVITGARRRSVAPQQQVLATVITTMVTYPNVTVRPTELRLRRVPAGAQIAEAITLQNMGTVEASVRLAEMDDFGPKGEWKLSLSSDHVNPVPMPLLLQPRSPPVLLYLLFRPMDVGSYEFYVPFVINGGAGPPLWGISKTTRIDYYVPGGTHKNSSLGAPKLPCLHVDATVARRIVGVSSTEFNFKCSTGDPSSNITRQVFEVNRMDLRALNDQTDFSDTMAVDLHGAEASRQSFSHASGIGFNPWSQSILQDAERSKEVFHLWMPLRFLRNTPFTVTAISGYLGIPQRAMTFKMSRDEFQSTVASKAETSIAEGESQINRKESVLGRYESIISAISDPVFNIEDEGEEEEDMILCSPLGPEDNSFWEIKFAPKERGVFTVTLPVYLTGFLWSNSPLVRLELIGVNEGPSITVDTEEIFLPPRPLHVPSEAKIWLEARNFEQDADVTWICKDVQSELGNPVPKDCLQVVLIKKRVQRGPGVTRLMGTVVFKAARPMGICARIVLSAIGVLDVQCTLKVVAVADCSLFTTHSFLRSHHLPYEIVPLGRGASTGSLRRQRTVRGRTTQFSPQPEQMGSEAVNDDDWPMELKSLQSMNVSFMESTASSASSLAEAVVIAAVNAAVESAVPVVKVESLPSIAVDSKQLEAFSQRLSLAEAASGGPRRHRGESRCDVGLATVDADEDSLGSSESSEDEDAAQESKGPTGSSARVHEMFKDVDEAYGSCRLFPDVRDSSDFANYLRRVNQAVEEWTYDVCFRREYWAALPFGMNECYRADRGPSSEVEAQGDSTERVKKKKESPQCPFGSYTPFVALQNIAGTDAVDLVLGRKSSDDIDKSKESVLGSMEGGGGTGHVAFKIKESEISESPGLEVPADALSTVQRYATFLHMMRCNGAVLPHVRPEYLLDYTRYGALFPSELDAKPNDLGCKSESSVGPCPKDDFSVNWSLTQLSPKLTVNMHRRVSHMAWIDVGLQMARTFWLPKIDEEHTRTLEDLRMPRAEDGLDLHSRQYNVASVANHSLEELYLLAWLNEHFGRARKTLCPLSPSPPPPRMVENFDSDLADGLVLAGVTVAICPYLREYMPDLFAEVTSSEEAQHNAARLISAWGAIRVGFTVNVPDLVKPVGVKMLLLVAYLYNVLPTMSASSDLNISAPLSTRGHTSLTLVNPSSQRLFYLAEFIGDTGSFFSAMAPGGSRVLSSTKCAATIFPVNPGQRVNINVFFHARTFKKQDCTLVLTGNLYAPNFGRAVAFHLQGEPSSLDVSATLQVTSTLYRPTQRNLKLPLPYALNPHMTLPLEFDLYLQEMEPEVCKAFLGRTWAHQRSRKVLRRLSLNQNHLVADHEPVMPPPQKTPRPKLYDGKESVSKATTETPHLVAQLSATICAFTPFTRHFWIGCVHPTFGDFIVKLVSRPTVCHPMETLKLPLPMDWRSAKCTCGGRMSLFEGMNENMLCPLISRVMVPSRNTALWKAVFSMFNMTLDDVERRFWKRYLDSQIGVRLVQWILEKNEGIVEEYDYIFNSSTTYNTFISSSHVNGPSEFTIQDLLSSDYVPLMVHLDNQTPVNLHTRMKLTSTDGRELRIYNLVAELPAGWTSSRPRSDRSTTNRGSAGKSTVGTISGTSDKTSINRKKS